MAAAEQIPRLRLGMTLTLYSDFQNACAPDAVLFQRLQRVVSLIERKNLHFGMNGDRRGDLHEIATVLSRVVGHAANAALLIDEVIREGRDRAHVNSA